ncbi:DUF7683 domain-containing protein [Sutcliffiella rhizosphaerae]|uniref:DUF7683 domain-containing protein n=1 Tax=Sutcliffiella rhizosphaerae TaxID=2880967 RepID=A0ABM8YNK6_9BACI|nr:hypothetical protein [Sutcliffiella rhizosphaerae]CAG9621556.1 hypothetical protein BACCIP111883_02329 [Sutcliffiella rhizosphaerae]
MNQWRVTKYNPIYRDEHGHFTLREEWTSPSEIWKTINGEVLTLDKYLQVEATYIDSIIKFMDASDLDYLRVMMLSINTISEEEKTSALYYKDFEKIVLQEDKIVNRNEIRQICKMILRDFIFCQFYNEDKFFVHFGWDYYMYIGSYVKCLPAIEFAVNNDLFVESMKSPYLLSERELIRTIAWNEVHSKIIIGEEELSNNLLDDYKKIFHLSEEHPVIGSFRIREEDREFFQPLIKHQMDFKKYEYFFNAGD